MADDAVKVLHEVFNGPGKLGGRVSLVADSRTNSLIVVKASPADLEVIKKLLTKVVDVEVKPAK
jgi:type II secretory pathway component HofQ